MKSYSSLRRRAAIGRARHGSGAERRRFRARPAEAGVALLPLYAPPPGTSPGEAGRETLHLRIAEAAFQASSEAMPSEVLGRIAPAGRDGGGW